MLTRMPRADRTVNVFLASPGDVHQERELVYDIIQRLNETVARPLGWELRPWGWELRRPGLGRPQDLINPKVDTCDVLVGLLHLGFGTPTGEYESGFEEEFERVRKRSADGEEVEALLYLREVAGATPDPRNLAFRERLKDIAFYYPYASIEELRWKLTEHLAGLVADFAGRSVEVGDDAGSTPLPASRPVAELPAGQTDEEGPNALRHVAANLAGEAEPPDRVTLLRAQLAASSELSNRVTSSLMHVHDLVRLYEHRGDLRLSEPEAIFLSRTLVGLGDTAPAWGLVGHSTDEYDIGLLGAADHAENVRAGAFRELAAGGLDAFAHRVADGSELQDPLNVLAKLWELEADPDVRRALVEALGGSRIEGVDLLLAIICGSRGEEKVGAFEALGDRLLGSDPTGALELLLEKPSWMPSDAEQRLVGRAEEVDHGLLGGLLTGSPSQRRVAYKLLLAGDRLDATWLGKALLDDDEDTRRIALRAALASNVALEQSHVEWALRRNGKWSPDDEAEALRLEFLKRQTPETLMAASGWGRLSPDGGVAVQAAMVVGHEPAIEKARRDLADGLASARAHARDLATAITDAKDRETRLADFERYQATYDSVYLEALLVGLARGGRLSSDADLARPYLDYKQASVRDAAADVLLRVGAAQDLDRLVAYAGTVYQERRRAVLAQLLDTKPDGNWLVPAVEGIERPELLLASALHAVADRGLGVDVQRLDVFMRHARADVRTGALRVATTDAPREQVRVLIDAYLGARGYRYYDVVGILDRLVYAPDTIRNETRKRLEHKRESA